jgi:predicted membrane channel-forming protein YqfA (hemolysin III family)
MNKDCVTYKETPKLFCEPYIHNGFRPINRPYSYYMKSLFKKHNETVNSISHYLGALLCLSRIISYDFSDPYSWPLMTSTITAATMFSFSATAHLMHQKSHYCHMSCFLCDFTGISLHLFGAALIQTFYCSPLWYYKTIENSYLTIIAFLSVLCCLCNCFAQVNYKRPYPPIKRIIQFTPLVICWSFTLLPLVLLYFSNNKDSEFIVDFKTHGLHITLFLLGGAFFGLDFPQRFFPGKFDFFGQGHNLFHICIFLVEKFQFKACYNSYLANYDHIVATRVQPTMQLCFLSVIILFIYDIYIIRSCRKMISHNFDTDGNLITKEAEDQMVTNSSYLH